MDSRNYFYTHHHRHNYHKWAFHSSHHKMGVAYHDQSSMGPHHDPHSIQCNKSEIPGKPVVVDIAVDSAVVGIQVQILYTFG